MRSFVTILFVALLGCILIVMVTPFVRRSVVIVQLGEAAGEIETGQFSEAEKRLLRYQKWAVYHPAIHQELLCKLIEAEVRLGKIGSARKWADAVHKGAAHFVRDTPPEGRNFLRDWPDQVASGLFATMSESAQAWDPDIGRRVLLNELWKMEQYEQLIQTAKKILEDDPEDQAARAKLAIVANRQQAPTIVERTTSGGTSQVSRPARPPPPPPPPRPAGKPAVTIVKPPEPAAEPAGTFEEVASAADPQESRIRELRARETELVARLKARRKTLTDNRPSTEAERARDSAQRRYDGLRERAMKLEEEMNSSTGQKRINILEEMRGMKGKMMRCQQELEKAQEAAKAVDAKRSSEVENDSEIKAIEKDLAGVRNELKSP